MVASVLTSVMGWPECLSTTKTLIKKSYRLIDAASRALSSLFGHSRPPDSKADRYSSVVDVSWIRTCSRRAEGEGPHEPATLRLTD